MSSIDERIVEMKFNNGQFQKGVTETTKSLDDLKKGLNLDGAKNGLNGLKDVGKGFSLDNIADGIASIAGKFTALGMVGVTALVNIANRAVDTGVAMAKSLTVDPIMDGFAEYELKMGSIQTILANTARHGTTLKQVTASLDELNTYADKTIYNFGDMTKNIGLFTNAGIKVDDATSMIKGFSNEAAASGTSAQGAAGAAYQLSQALSAGTIRLMDWRSLTNVGMGNKNMQNGLIEIADAMGTLTANSTSATEVQSDFNGSLEKNWLSADVMSTYLQIMAGDMDEAAMSALGLSKAQIEGFQKQAQTAEEAATKVRTWTQLIDTLREGVGSSWAQTFDLILGDFDEATELFTAISERLGSLIEAAGTARNDALAEWDDLGGRTAMLEALSNAFNVLMEILGAVGEAFTEVFPPITGKQLAEFSTGLRDLTAQFKMGESDLNNLKSTFKGFFAILSIGWSILKGAAGVILELLGVVSSGTGGFLEFTGGIGDFFVALDQAIKSGDGLTKFFEGLGKVLKFPLELLMAFVGVIFDLGRGLSDIDTSGFDAFADAIQARLESLTGIGTFLGDVWRGAMSVFQRIGQALKPIGEYLGDVFGDLGKMIADGARNMDFNMILDMVNTGLLAGIVLAVRKFFKGFGDAVDGGGGLLDGIKDIFGGLTDTLGEMQTTLKSGTLIAIALAVALLTASVATLSTIDSGALTKALTAITVMFTQLMATLAVFTKISAGGLVGLPTVAAGLILISIAVNILASAVEKMSGLDWNGLAKGLTGITVVLGALVATSKLMSKNAGGMISAGLGMIAMATGVKILASAVSDLAGLSWEELGKGLLGIGAILGGLMLFTKMAAINKGAMGQAVGLILLGVALNILAQAVSSFGGMSWESIGKGMVGIAGGLLLLAGAMAIMPEGILLKAAGLVVVGLALKLLADAMTTMGGMSWEEIAKGLVVLAGALAIIAGAMYLMTGALAGAAALLIVSAALSILGPVLQGLGSMSWEEIGKGLVMLAGSLVILAAGLYLMTGAIAGAAALTIASVALTMLVPVLQALGGMSWEQIGTGLGALAATLGILALAGIALLPAIPGLIGLGIALGLIGLGVMLAGVGVAALAAGLTALSVAGAAGTTTLVAMGTALAGLIPMILEQIALGIVAFAGVLAESGPVLVEALVTLLSSLLEAIGAVIPQALEVFTQLIMTLLEAINTVAPEIINTLFNLIMALVNNLVTAVPQFVTAGINLITGILNGIANTIGNVITAATNVIIAFLNGISQNLPRVIQSGINLIINFLNGIANAIRNNSARMQAAGQNIASAIVEGIVGGLSSGVGWIVDTARNLAGSALDAVKDFLGIESPSREFFKVGAWSAEGQALGMKANAGQVADASTYVGQAAVSAMHEAMSQLSNALEFGFEDPVIKPVLDLSDLQANIPKVDKLLDGFDLSADGAFNRVLSIMDDRREVDDPDRGPEDPGGTSLYFYQTNESPKALDDIEIYRKTNNLLSQAKGALTEV